LQDLYQSNHLFLFLIAALAFNLHIFDGYLHRTFLNLIHYVYFQLFNHFPTMIGNYNIND
jgi:hypothetical protein